MAGVSQMGEEDKVMSTINTMKLRYECNDPANLLKRLLPNSSNLGVQGGSRHTTPSMASFFSCQNNFRSFPLLNRGLQITSIPNRPDLSPVGVASDPLSPVLNGTSHTESEMNLLREIHNMLVAFVFTQTPGELICSQIRKSSRTR